MTAAELLVALHPASVNARKRTPPVELPSDPLPEGWVWATLGDVCGQVKKTDPQQRPDESFCYVDISSIDNGRNIVASPKQLFGAEAPSRARQILKVGDVVFSTVRTYLKNVAAIGAPLDGAVASTGFCVLRPLINPSYVFHMVLSERFLKRLEPLQRGTSYPAVRDGDLFSQPIPVPPLDEQEQIAARIDELFSDLDAGDVAVGDAERGVRGCRQATLNALVLGSLENPEYAHTVKNGKPVLPSGWEWATLGDLAEMVQYGTGDKAQSEQTSIPVLRILNVKQGRVDANNLKYMSEGWAGTSKYLLQHGDLLFIRTNGSRDLVGTAAMYTGYPANAVSASYLITVRLNPKRATPEFVLHCLNSAFGRGYIASVVSQVGQANVNGTKLKAFPIPLPPLEEQVRLASKADEMLTQLDALQRDLVAAQRQSELLRQSTLAAAFSGQLI